MATHHEVRPLLIGEGSYHCSVRGCLEEGTHLATFRYASGKKARIAFASVYRCDKHARQFAENHNIEVGDEQANQD